MATCHVLVADLEYHAVNSAILRMLPWLDRAGEQDVRVLSLLDGGIRREFRALAPVVAVNEYRPRRPSTALRELGLARPAEMARSAGLRRRLSAGSVYLADVRAARLLHWAAPSVVVVGHLRRGDDARCEDLGSLDRVGLNRVDHWVVDDEAGADVVLALGIDAARITRFREDVDLDRLWPDVRASSRAERRTLLEAAHGIPADVPLVCSGGHIDFWHQTDVFLQLCWSVRLARPGADIHFAWLAEDSTERMLWPLRHDIAHAGLDHCVHVVDREPPPLLEGAAAADVFVRTNRHGQDKAELEAMDTVGVPTVEFERTGAMARSVTVPWIDVPGMREAVLTFLDDDPPVVGLGPLPLDSPSVWDRRVGAGVLAGLLETAGPR